MSRNGAGTMNLPTGFPVSTGTTIQSTQYNNAMQDVCNELTNSIARDGQTPPTANLPMGGFRHTNVADAIAATDYASFGQLTKAAGSYSAAYSYSSNQVLTTSHWGAFITFTVSATTCQLPTPVGAGGKKIAIYNAAASGVVTLSTAAGSLTGPDAVTSLGAGEIVTYVSNGVDWICTEYRFPRSYVYASNGYFTVTTSASTVPLTESIDDLSEFSLETFTAKNAGVYEITATSILDVPTSSALYFRIRKGSTVIAFGDAQNTSTVVYQVGSNPSIKVRLAASDTITLWCHTYSGTGYLSFCSLSIVRVK